MAWTWTLEDAEGGVIGRSEPFDSRGDAESWVGEEFGALLGDGIAQVSLYDGDDQVYGPMSLSPE